MTPAAQLRALIRNADGIIDALPAPGDYSDERGALMERLGDAIRRLQLRRIPLTAGCSGHPETLAGYLVTTSAGQPASISSPKS
ncbi:MAG TPA: hypothetical protein VHN79_03655 [Lacunisphaera sp.]|nr:hypothetical protein [Lacunisphaera sp.]